MIEHIHVPKEDCALESTSNRSRFSD